MSDILSSYLTSLCTITRLYGDSALMEAVMQDKASEVEPGTDLQELVTNEDFDVLVSSRRGFIWGFISFHIFCGISGREGVVTVGV